MDLTRTHYINLGRTEEGPHRPELGFYVEDPNSDHDDRKIVVQLGQMMGQPMRFIELSIEETHTLVKLLVDLARAAIEAQATTRTAPEVAEVLNRDAS